jgi:Transport protein Avl9
MNICPPFYPSSHSLMEHTYRKRTIRTSILSPLPRAPQPYLESRQWRNAVHIFYAHRMDLTTPSRCNRQIAASDLLVKADDVTRSTVQKAIVVLASKPVFGPIRLAGTPTGPYALRSSRLLRRDKLGVVTRAFFNQRDFSETDILIQFYERLEGSLRTQLTESGLYMGMLCSFPQGTGNNLQFRHKPVSCKDSPLKSVLTEFHRRELVHAFRHRTLVLLKALMLQRRVRAWHHI